MSKKIHLSGSIVGFFLELKPEANLLEFEKFMLAQVSGRDLATYTLSKALNSDRAYVWTARIGVNTGGVDRGGRPIVLDDVLGAIRGAGEAFPLKITDTFWCQGLTADALIGEFNKLPGHLIEFAKLVEEGTAPTAAAESSQ